MAAFVVNWIANVSASCVWATATSTVCCTAVAFVVEVGAEVEVRVEVRVGIAVGAGVRVRVRVGVGVGMRKPVRVGRGVAEGRISCVAAPAANVQVAGKLRGDLQQYRELLTFAQFGTELDKISQAQLDRGKRLTELLKQGQYVPLPVEKEVLALFAGGRGYLDSVPVELVQEYERQLYIFVDKNHPEILAGIRDKKQIDMELEKAIKAVLEEFGNEFKEVKK